MKPSSKGLEFHKTTKRLPLAPGTEMVLSSKRFWFTKRFDLTPTGRWLQIAKPRGEKETREA
jgi:hypothetical protein